MMKFLFGVIVGIVVSTIGVDGSVKLLSESVTRVQAAAKAAAQ